MAPTQEGWQLLRHAQHALLKPLTHHESPQEEGGHAVPGDPRPSAALGSRGRAAVSRPSLASSLPLHDRLIFTPSPTQPQAPGLSSRRPGPGVQHVGNPTVTLPAWERRPRTAGHQSVPASRLPGGRPRRVNGEEESHILFWKSPSSLSPWLPQGPSRPWTQTQD